jgi:hypothetical protein
VLILSIRLNHLFPFNPLARAASIGSVHTPRSALWRCHRSSSACLSPEPIGGGTGADGSSRFMVSAFPLSCLPSLHGRYPASSLLWTALTSARLRLRGFLPGQLSTRPHDTFPAFSPQPSPTTPLPLGPQRGMWSGSVAAHRGRLRQSLAGSPLLQAESGSLSFGTAGPPRAAPHPASRRRSCLRLLSRCSSREDSDFHWLISCMCARTRIRYAGACRN